MTAQVGDQSLEFVVGVLLGRGPHQRVGAHEELGTSVGRIEREQRLVGLVGHCVDVGPQRLTAGFLECAGEPAAVLRFGHVPAGVAEEVLEPFGDDARNHPIETLTIEVHDHGEVAEPFGHRLGDRLPHVALVELGIAHERDESSVGSSAEVGVEVPPGQGTEQWRNRTEPDRTGGEVGDVGILGARRVGLETTTLAQFGQVGAIELTGEVLDRVVDG